MGENSKIIIKDATYDDLTAIAGCHRNAFPESLTSILGISFISDMLAWYLSGQNKFLFWIEEDGICIGYCGGYVMDGTDAYGASSGMTQFGFNSAIKAIIKKPWLAFHPEIISKYKFIWTNIKRKFYRKTNSIASTNSSLIIDPINPEGKLRAGLVVIGVQPDLHKKGLGSMLIKEFETRAAKRGATLFSLSVRKENNKAIAAYERNNWHIVSDDGPSFLMTKQI